MSLFNKIGKGISSAASSVAGGVKSAAGTVASGAKSAADKVASGVTSGAKTVGSGVTSGAKKVGSGFNDVAGDVEAGAGKAWEASSEEAQALGHAIEASGTQMGESFVDGMKTAGDEVGEAAEKAGAGLVSLGHYASPYACDIALGSGLSAAFAALAAEGTEETFTGALAVMALTQFADNVALRTTARGLAEVIATPVYAIPGVDKVVNSRSELASIISFLIVKACKRNPKLVIGSAGQFLAGALIYGITKLVCEGTIPGGYQAWAGAQASV